MNDRVVIRDLSCRGIIGIHLEERTTPQDVLVNLSLETDTRPAARSDAIADAVDYDAISRRVGQLVAESGFRLVERLAESIAELCLEDDRVLRVRVRVEKPSAIEAAAAVGVEIERERPERGDETDDG